MEINDNDLFDKLDFYIENMPLEVLEETKIKLLEDGSDTSVIDKAIKNKKIEIRKNEIKRKNNNKIIGKTLLSCTILGLRSNSKTEDFNDKINYDSTSFEEEELEDDDYYYEDLD